MGYMEDGMFGNENDVCLPLNNIWGYFNGYIVLRLLNPSEALSKPRKIAISFVLAINSGMLPTNSPMVGHKIKCSAWNVPPPGISRL